MQGTIAMLMALSGLGCHHKSCAPVVVDSCYTSGYNSCYAAPVYTDVVIPASANSFGNRSCNVPNTRSERPRACGE